MSSLRVQVETGPKGKKVAAVAPDWPGLSRGDKTAQAALDRLHSYVPRYAPVATLAGQGDAFTAATDLDVVEHYPGTGSTDFWGISFAFSSIDREPLSGEELERQLALLRACWTFFDDVRSRVSAEMKKGPRGGGRDRDAIVVHTLMNEVSWNPKPGSSSTQEAILTDDGLREHRASYVEGIRDLHAEGRTAGKWPLRYLIRHTAYHTLDHAWEMEDKDLTNVEVTPAS